MIEQEQNTQERRGRTTRRTALTIAGIFALAAAGAFGLAVRGHIETATAAETAAVNTERVRIAVEGMHCSGCASGIRAMLRRTPGVVSAEVSYENKEAVVEYEPGRITREKIAEAIANMGYKVSIKA